MLETISGNIRKLGASLGQTIANDQGEYWVNNIEQVRKLGRSVTQNERDAIGKLQRIIKGCSEQELLIYARAFSQFLNLLNIAEQQYTTSEKGLIELDLPHPLASLSSKLEGKNVDDIKKAFDKLHIELVLTAHPTEVNRRTFIHKYHEIAEELPDEEQELSPRVEELIEQAWHTNQIRSKRPSPLDESRWGLNAIADSLWDSVPQFVRELDELAKELTGEPLPKTFMPITMASWQGGDRDGNPFVTAQLSDRAITQARLRAAELYLVDFEKLYLELSMHKADSFLIEADITQIGPYRYCLRKVIRKLQDSIALLKEGKTEGAICSADELLTPLYQCRESLLTVGLHSVANSHILDLIRKVQCFGISLVKLDIRQHSERHDATLAEITQALGLGDYLQWSEQERVDFLLKELSNPRPLLPKGEWTPDTQEVLDTFYMIASQPQEAMGIYIISMASQVSDVLVVNLLMKATGVSWDMPIAPLFETLDDLNNATQVMGELLKVASYVERCKHQHYVMIGYSDSAKDAGVLAATWAQYQAQESLVALFEKNDVELKLFHGRGGTIGRGGGPAHAAVASQPPGSLDGGLRVTEQGETIRHKYGLPRLAVRSLHLYASAILESLITPPPAPKQEWRDLMDQMAEQSCDVYRDYIRGQDAFVRYFRQATPEQELSSLPLGSRPSKRKSDGGIESLRAIPWIFAWSQNRLVVPSWLGLGQAIADFYQENAGLMREMLTNWPYFKARISLTEMVYLKSDSDISALYDSELVEPELQDLGAKLRTQLKQDEQSILTLLDQTEIMQNDQWNLNSFNLRQQYLVPLHIMQVEALKRLREKPEHPECEQVLMVTMAGVATGMRNTG
ncbi:phosphoenolpyruvate carboxylase [Saccharobesus litoralis]|uniref:Phosphoenolpyruvate carboxylase n=1 Tax=Saccharobesus litoralis TaxID=2172099 RepID=A0A2S0VQ67_9ALTE|nr:phosphoenolpyruvate carboxylase [Saccharobesus litoralis]AWB66357.1 phosphoenolpyruvate carboxylase [Saccharobesus litoralis]